MSIRKAYIGILSIVLLLAMAMPLTVLADSDNEYPNIEIMTDEEVQEVLIRHGFNLDKMQMPRADLINYIISVDEIDGRISVVFFTVASMVANEIGVKGLDLIEFNSSGSTELVSDYKNYDCFKRSHYGGFFYDSPRSGYTYYAHGTNYAIFTTTPCNRYTVSDQFHY